MKVLNSQVPFAIMSTIDWCEENYVVSPHIAEWYNTLSSGTLVAVGLFGIQSHRAGDASVFWTLVVVGIGSILFHALLTHWAQMLDEVPMVILLLQLCHMVLPDIPKTIYRAFGTVFCLTMTYTAYHKDEYARFEFFFFQFGYVGVCTLYTLYSIWLSGKYLAVRSVFFKGGLVFLTGWFFWLFEQRFCEWIIASHIPVQLHAWWHIFSAIGAYHLCVFSIYVSHAKAGNTVNIGRVLYLPRVVFPVVDKKMY